MEILIALNIFLIGGYLLGLYFLFVYAITAKTKKGKIIGFMIFVIWLLIPLINHAQQEIQNSLYERKLENTLPTEELVKEAFTKLYNKPYLYLPEDFYTLQEGHLMIKVDTLEEEFIEHARSQYQFIVEDAIDQKFQTKQERIEEYMIGEVFGRHLFDVYRLHFEIWNRTTAPTKVTVNLYYADELIDQSTSTGFYQLNGQENYIEKVEQFYQTLKPEIINQ